MCPSDARKTANGASASFLGVFLRKTRSAVGRNQAQNGHVGTSSYETRTSPTHLPARVTIVAAGGTVVVATTALLAVDVARSPSGFQVVSAGPAGEVVGVVVTVATALLAGVALWAGVGHPGRTRAMAFAVAGSFIPLWSGSPSLPPTVRVAAFSLTPVTLLGALLLSRDREPGVPAVGRRVPHMGSLGCVGGAVLVQAVTYNPFSDPRCPALCDVVTPPLHDLVGVRTGVHVAAGLTVVGAVLAGVALLQPPRPRAVLLVGAMLALLLVSAGAVTRVLGWEDLSFRLGPGALPLAATATLSVAVLTSAWRTARTRASVARLTTALSDTAPALGPGTSFLGIQFAVPGESRWIDAGGNPAPDPVQHGSVVLHDGPEPVLCLVLPPGEDEDDVVDRLDGVTRFALRNAQLTALARARLLDVRESQRRVVVASDGERRRIERDLHDGAQQRLVSVTLHLRLALKEVAGAREAESLMVAERHVLDGLAGLRNLAHGVFPAALAGDGLLGAIDDLAVSLDVPLDLDADLRDEPGPEVSMAAYAVVKSVLAGATTPRASAVVRIRDAPAALELSVHLIEPDVGTPPRARPLHDIEVADRVGALGGTLTTSRGPGADVTVAAVIPCGS